MVTPPFPQPNVTGPFYMTVVCDQPVTLRGEGVIEPPPPPPAAPVRPRRAPLSTPLPMPLATPREPAATAKPAAPAMTPEEIRATRLAALHAREEEWKVCCCVAHMCFVISCSNVEHASHALCGPQVERDVAFRARRERMLASGGTTEAEIREARRASIRKREEEWKVILPLSFVPLCVSLCVCR